MDLPPVVLVFAFDPLVLATVLAVREGSDAVFLDLDVGADRLAVFRVADVAAGGPGEARLTLEQDAHVESRGGAVHHVAIATTTAAGDLATDTRGELRVVVGGRARVVVPVALRDEQALGLWWAPPSTRPTLREAA